MPRAVEKLKLELAELSSKERAEMARYLIGSLENEPEDDDAGRAWDVELERRALEIREGKVVGESADKVLAELRARYT